MTEQPKPPDPLGRALDRWEQEGGAPAVPWPLQHEIDLLPAAERRILECLGAALVGEWHDLPTAIQRRLFAHATTGKSNDAAALKARIAKFLHDHREDPAAG